MKHLVFGAALAFFSAGLFAQPRIDCSQAKDPKACEERVGKMKAARAAAKKACEGKAANERAECMRTQMCAESKDTAKCEADARERMARRHKIHEACKDKRGEDLKACIRDQRSQK